MKRKNFLFPLLIFSLLIFSGSFLYAQEKVKGPTQEVQAPEEKADEELIQIKKKTEEAKKDIRKTEDKIEEAQAEAEQVKAESEVLGKEAEIKAQEAEITQKELKVLKEEAKNGGKDAKEKVKELEQKAKELKGESKALAEKSRIAEEKSKLAEASIAAQQEKMESLKKKFDILLKEKSNKKSWRQKGMDAGIIFGIGLLFFIILKLGVHKFDHAITHITKDQISESDAFQRMRTISRLVNWVGGVVIVLTVIYLLLENFGFNVTPLLAGAGILGLSFGFGGQYLIRDIISGIFILMEGQYHIKDVIKIGDLAGLVEDVNLRVTKLRDLEGRVIYIPNGEIKSVINYTKIWSRALLNVGVAYKENVDHVMQVIKDVGKEMREDSHFKRLIMEDLEMLGVDDFGDSEVTIKFFIKTLPLKQWDVAREFRRRLKNRFDELGIEIPFPHRTIYWGSGTDNDSMKDYFLKKK